MQIHLQRIVGAFVGSAYGAATFYQSKVTDSPRPHRGVPERRPRRGPRPGWPGSRARPNAPASSPPEMGLQAYALMAAAEGAVHAYAHVTGETWKPYEAPIAASSSTARKSAAEELAAFG